MKKRHNSIRAVSFQVFHCCPFDNFPVLSKESSIPKYFITTVKINAASIENFQNSSESQGVPE